VICIYFILLIPYVVHSNLSHSGLVISSEDIPIGSLPEGIRRFIIFKEKPVIVFIKQQTPIWLDRSVTEWTIALITTEKFPSGTFIEFISPVARMYVNWREYPFDQIFDELVIADVVREVQQFEVNIEYLLSSPYGRAILALSAVNYYLGPFVFVLITYIFKKRPTLWSIAIIPWCYSAATLICNRLAIHHYNYVPEALKYFGYLFIALTPLVLLSWAYERTPQGRAVAEKLFTFAKELKSNSASGP
jgi:hypothetical protein